MKRNDLIGLILAVVLLGGVGIIFYNSQSSHKASAAATKSQTAEVVPVINGTLDSNKTLDSMASTYKVQDYKTPVDPTTGVGNTVLFGQ